MFGQKRRLNQQADTLIKIARVSVMGLLVPLIDKRPVLKPLISDSGETWDFFMTLAAVAVCSYNIPSHIVPLKQQDAFLHALDAALLRWNRNAPSAVANMTEYLENFATSNMPIHWGYGCWVIHNLKGSEPTHEELDLGAFIGKLLETRYKEQIWGATVS